MNYLEKYKGKSTRHDCPGCGAKLSFTIYINGDTNEPIHKTVGKCNRESKCGYHYTPKQYFIDNPSFLSPPLGGGWVGSHTMSSLSKIQKSNFSNPSNSSNQMQPAGTIPFKYVAQSASYRSNFVRFLCEFLTTEQISYIGDNYALGATKTKEVIFWQIDINGKVRTGKIMQYNPTTGRRLKHQSGAIDWVHNKLKKSKELPEDFNLQQCFFGEHLLKIYPDKQVAIVESEKSAIIASVIMPDLIWLAAGNLNGLSIEKAKVLKGRNVTLFPDLGGYDKWSIKANEIKQSVRCDIKVSTILENIATESQRCDGLDIADYIIEELKNKTMQTQILSRFTPVLDQMILTNPALLILIDKLQFEEV
ncbi:MAG: hypothetical protein GZ091_06915 [Paludibacter sp.]|nr:hypothetical protein [Paludibacter sp.]